MRSIRYLLIFSLITPCLAQPGPGMGRDDGPMRQRVREKVKMIKIWRLTEAVGLTTEQSERFFPVYNKHQAEMENFEKENRDLLERIRQLTDNPNSGDSEIGAAMKDFKEHQHRAAQLQESFLSEISPILTVRQRGKLVVFEEEFRRDMQRLIADIRHEFRGGPGGRDRK